jgi:ribonuclease G
LALRGGEIDLSKEIVVNVGERETRIAVTEESKLVELHIEREERVVGSLYKAKVSNVLPGMDAAFVDIGLDRNAFLYVGDVLPNADMGSDTKVERPSARIVVEDVDEESDEEDAEPHEDSAPGEDAGEPSSRGRGPIRRGSTRRSVLRQQKIKDVLKVGQEILVQVIKGPRGTKGARVSTRISLPGRYLVLMPEADNVGISRKIEDHKERDRLKKIGDKLRETGFGIIIRTEAEDKTEQELKADKDFLLKMWRTVQEGFRKQRAPSMVHQDLTLVYKTIRDVFGSDVSRLVIDDPAEFEKANELLDMVSPKLRGRIHLYTGDAPVFDHYGIENEIDRLLKRKVWLRSGGYLIFDETEALTVIDVNTGKFTGSSSLSETIVKTNIDAANEIARQIRLRDIGGIIVIDFIDMNNPRDKQQVIKTLENALKKDRSRTKISSISNLGLVEMTRKRTGETITDFMTVPCSYCGGRGKLPSPESISILAERELRRVARNEKKEREALLITCHPDVAEVLVGPDGETVDRIEREIQRAVYVRADPEQHVEKFDIVPGKIADFDRKYGHYKRAQVVDCRVLRSLVQPEPGVVGWADGFLLSLNDGKKYMGQSARAKITDLRRSYASATVLPGTNRALDKTEAV